MPGLVIPEIEELKDNQPLFRALKKMADFLNGIPIISGTGHPEGNVTAPIGTLFVCKNPAMGNVLFQKLSDKNANRGWVGIGNSYSGAYNDKRSVGGTTAAAAFTAVGPTDTTIVVPPNCYQMNFNATFTGNGAMRIKIGTKISNELTASGKLTVNGLTPGSVQILTVEAKANAGNVTAMTDVVVTVQLQGSQMLGGRGGVTQPPASSTGSGSGETGEFGETCLVYGTLVAVGKGRLGRIERVRQCETHEGTIEAVIQSVPQMQSCYEVTVKGHKPFICSESQPLLNHRFQRIPVKMLMAGMAVMTEGGLAEIVAVRAVGRRRVRHITLAGPLHTFKIHGKIWAHNAKPLFG